MRALVSVRRRDSGAPAGISLIGIGHSLIGRLPLRFQLVWLYWLGNICVKIVLSTETERYASGRFIFSDKKF